MQFRLISLAGLCRVLRRRNCRIFFGVSVACFLIYNVLFGNLPSQNDITLGKEHSMKCSKRTRFVYIKMIKCASTTLARMFRRFGLKHNLSFVLPPKDRIYIGWPYPIDSTFYRPSKSEHGFDILCDHSVYNPGVMDQLLGPNAVYITSLREPFSQFKSMVNYYNILNISKVPVDVPDRFSEYVDNIELYEKNYKSPSPIRYCIPDGFSMTRNLMSFNLGFPTGGFLSAAEDQKSNIDLISTWIDSLGAKFDLVMIVEHFVESLVLLRRLMCWKLQDVLFHWSNTLPYYYQSQSLDRLVEIYRRWSNVDYVLYNHFNQTLWRKIRQQDVGFWGEVARLKHIVAEVEAFCGGQTKSSLAAELIIEESSWNEPFKLTMGFCNVFNDDLLNVLHEQYEHLTPVNIAEKIPSKTTC